jgi:hypothetical protein
VTITLPPDQQRATALIAVLRHAFFGEANSTGRPH